MTTPPAASATIPGIRTLPCGDDGLLVEVDDLDAVTRLYRQLRSDPPAGMVDCVPAARTLLITVDTGVVTPDAMARQLARHLRDRPEDRVVGQEGRLIEIPVTYDGPDLDATAATLDTTVGEVVGWHSAPTYRAAFFGFGPGFAYLTGLDPRLRLPRRTTPRTRVPGGSVAIADVFSAIYPWESPGGWHLLGSTDTALWQSDRTPPNLLNPGDRVRFVPRAG